GRTRDQSRSRLPLREVEGPPDRALRAPRHRLSANDRREPPRSGSQGERRAALPDSHQTEHRRLGRAHRAIRLARGSRRARGRAIGVGGVEYLVGRDDGRVYFYDVTATATFVANAPTVLGFDPFPQFADYIVRVAAR